MRGAKVLLIVIACGVFAQKMPVQTSRFNGASALEYTRRITALGPRHVDSEPHRQAERYIAGEVKRLGCTIEEDVFTAHTPAGPKRMNNIIARAPGQSGKLIVISGHYDTKVLPGTHFVGANDGGSSAGFLLEMARVLCGHRSLHDIYLVWFDGEESMRLQWSDEDSLYGSRRLAARWRNDGTLARLMALINVDMIGDKDLRILRDESSTAWLRELVWNTAAELGYSKHFETSPGSITDDHVPFLLAGVPALDLIDFNYGPDNEYWHTDRDTVNKLSARSFQVVGEVLLRAIEKLEKRS
jgi:Zn-dependent M28 family amino/carboxypeptidase